MLEAIEAVTIGDLAHLEGEIEAEIVADPAMTEVPEISEDQEMIDLEIGMIADHAIEMIGDLKEETMEEAIEAVTIGDLAHLEAEIEAEPAILQEEMIVVVIAIVVEIEIVESMIGDLLPVHCLQQETIE